MINNIFGDIIFDEVFMIMGFIGMLLLVLFREDSFGMYELIYGSVFDIVGKDIVNLIVIILFVSMMLRYSFNLEEEVKCIEDVV